LPRHIIKHVIGHLLLLFRAQGAISFARTYANSSAAEPQIVPTQFALSDGSDKCKAFRLIAAFCIVYYLFDHATHGVYVTKLKQLTKKTNKKNRAGKWAVWCVWKKVNKLQIPSRAFTFHVTSSAQKKEE